MKIRNSVILIALLLASAAPAQSAKPLFKVPIRNITKIAGTMNNMVQGFGLVTGLKGNGAKGGVSRRALSNAIKRFGINITEAQITSGNVAIVSVEAYLPPFSHIGGEVGDPRLNSGPSAPEFPRLPNIPLERYAGLLRPRVGSNSGVFPG